MSIMLFLFVMFLPALVESNLMTGDTDRKESLCNPDIPEDKNVELYGECRSTANCKHLDGQAECVEVSHKHCVCKVDGAAEERKRGKSKEKKWKSRQKKQCKKREGLRCVPRSRCQDKHNGRRMKNKAIYGKLWCKHPRRVCCAYCRNFENHQCAKAKSCPKKSIRTNKLCKHKNNVCCEKLVEVCGDSEHYTCEDGSTCPGGTVRSSGSCKQTNQVCCEITSVCENVEGHVCAEAGTCPTENVRASKYCKNENQICCEEYCKDFEHHTCIAGSACPSGTVITSKSCSDQNHVCCETLPLPVGTACTAESRCATGLTCTSGSTCTGEMICDCPLGTGYKHGPNECVDINSGFKATAIPNMFLKVVKNMQMNWMEAKEDCENIAGPQKANLVVIQNSIKNAEVFKCIDWFSWIGLKQDTHWVYNWVDGTSVTVQSGGLTLNNAPGNYYTFYDKESFDDDTNHGFDNQFCMIMIKANDKWSDNDCSVTSYDHVCEINL